MRFLKMSKLKAFWNSQPMFAKVVMVITLPIFAIVAGIEHLIAKITGTTLDNGNKPSSGGSTSGSGSNPSGGSSSLGDHEIEG